MKFIPSFLPVALSLSLLSLLASEAVFADTSVVNSADPSIVNSAKNTTDRASEASLDSSENGSEQINQQVAFAMAQPGSAKFANQHCRVVQ